MTIHVEDLKFACIIGILDFEREKEQEVIVTIALEYDNKKGFINYADIVEIVKIEMKKNKFLLIEDALERLKFILTEKYNSTKKISIKITKPSILSDCKVSVSTCYTIQS